MTSPRIAVLTAEHVPPPHNLDALSQVSEVTLTDKTNLSQALKEADILLVWDFFSTALEKAWPDRGDLKWIHVAAAGVDAVLFDGLRNSNVTVTNAHGVFDRPIAEFVLASILAHDKQLHASKSLQRQGKWEHRELTRTEGSSALIVGTGGIGRVTAQLLKAVGIDVRGVGRRAREQDPDFGSVFASSELAAHAPWADTIVLAAPLTAETTNLIARDVLAAMKPTAHLINVGRGRLVDEKALIETMSVGAIGHASLDVFSEEPLPSGHRFWSLDNVSVSAHMSGDVHGWRQALADQFLLNVRRFLAGQEFPHEVDKVLGYVRQTTVHRGDR
ncbi:D-2-hydroxyacid dehydrogenase [Paenarthrobacter sp. NPDC089714]|uniref:D-2-hydroxyacid dehydrogenase n=1 Tax=Paenarthrobacter sp. NPDC089714 TaxID=3364377 RepID=UPI0038004F66